MAVAGDPRGYYQVLGVERTASADDIKTAFRHRAKSLHPDQGGGGADKEAFRRLLEAYEALRDPQQRLRYDTESLAADRSWSSARCRRELPQHRRPRTSPPAPLNFVVPWLSRACTRPHCWLARCWSLLAWRY